MKSARRSIVNHKAVFRPRTSKDDNNELSQDLIISARKSGCLDLSKKGLHTVPEKIWCINDTTEEETKTIFNLSNASTETIPWWEQETLKHLNLSYNSLKTIESNISCLTDLHTLYLNDNILEQLPESFGTLKNLRDLNLSSNKLKHLEIFIYELVELKILNLKQNFLESLNPAIGDLVMLETLDISYNNLLTLPVGLGYLVRLKSLNFSHNQLKDIPPDITNMRALKTLDLSFNNLEKLPPLGELRKVENIFLQDNRLIEFPDINGCVDLRNLHLSNNNIKEISANNLESLGKLKIFIIKNNEIEIIPKEIIQLINLEQFDVSQNKISQLPHSISSLPNLRNFNIDGNESLNIRSDIIHCGTWRILKYLREKIEHSPTESQNSTLPGETVSHFPDKYTMRKSRLLSLVGQNISQIPTSVFENAKEAEVSCIDLNKNKLQELPDGLSLVKTVMDLKISCNCLKLFPEWIAESLNNLRFIDLSKNQLSSLPTSLNCLEHLIEVNISFNRFTTLPDCLYEVPSLHILIANDNQIDGINAMLLKNLKKLATLDLSNNNISYVPPELGNLQNIRSLQLHGNCFKQPRQATLMGGTDAILTYLRDRIPTPR